ncbi:MAG: response regulator [bacterium]
MLTRTAAEGGGGRHAMVVEADPGVRAAMQRLLPSATFSVEAFGDGDAAWVHARRQRLDLVLIDRTLPGLPGTRLCEMLRTLPWGASIGVVLVSTAYTDPYVGAADCGSYGADAFLPLPAAPALVEARLGAALSRREPLERLGVLPVDRARYIDALFERLDRLSYYELLELDADADEGAIRRAFHARSLVLHPDRYTALRTAWPHAYDRINGIYKRFNEASRVLMDAGQRARYNLGLQQRGAMRLEQSRRSKREEKELAMCRLPATRDLVLQSLELRSLGDLEGAEEPMAEACALEPDNVDLGQVLAAIRKLLDIMRRG